MSSQPASISVRLVRPEYALKGDEEEEELPIVAPAPVPVPA